MFNISNLGSAPGLRIKMSGVKEVPSLIEYSKSNGGGVTYLYPISSSISFVAPYENFEGKSILTIINFI